MRISKSVGYESPIFSSHKLIIIFTDGWASESHNPDLSFQTGFNGLRLCVNVSCVTQGDFYL